MFTEKRATLPEAKERPSAKVISLRRLPRVVYNTRDIGVLLTETGAQANQRSPDASVCRVMVWEAPLEVSVPSSPQ